jgi:hypothetical protein
MQALRAVSLGYLWRDQGSGEEARDLLVSIYGWFAEGFDTAHPMALLSLAS